MTMGPLAYTLCAVTASGCTWLLWAAFRRSGSRLLLWSALCFACLTLNNALVVTDLVLLPEVNLFLIRNLSALCGAVLLLYGLIWES
jgi:uncharacterized protein DUF5985